MQAPVLAGGVMIGFAMVSPKVQPVPSARGGGASGGVDAPPRPVLRRLLPSLTVLLVLLIAGAGTLLYRQHQQQLTKAMAADVADISSDLQQALNQQAETLAVAVAPIALDPGVPQALRAGDADRLLAVWQPVFETLRREHQITHLKFLDANRICLLRVHKPEVRGDRDDRSVALEAQRTGTAASGIELGQTGNFNGKLAFTLRVVRPIFEGDKLAGYVELGKEIADVLQAQRAQAGLAMAVTVPKSRLNRQDWENGMRLLGQEADWDRLPRSKVIYLSQGNLPAALVAWAEHAVDYAHGEVDRSITSEGHTWRVAATPLQDVAGQEVGDLLILRDITAAKAGFARQLALGGTAGGVLLALLLGFVYSLLRRTDAGIHAQQESLRKQHQLLTDVITGTHVGTWRWNVQTGETEFNERWAQIVGSTLAELAPLSIQTWLGLVHPDDVKESEAMLRKHFAGTLDYYDCECRMRHKDGSWVWVHDRGQVSTWTADGKPLVMTGTHADITARKQAENDASRQAATIGALLDSIPDLIFFKDINGVYMGCNPAFAEFVGKARAEIVTKTDYDLFEAGIADSFRAHDRCMLEGRESRRNEEWITYPDGRKILLDTLKTPYYGPNGTLLGTLGISRDITARKQAEEALRERSEALALSEAHGQLILNSVAEGIYGIDLHGNCTFCNQAGLRLLGYQHPDELLGKHMHCQVHAKHAEGTLFPVEESRIFQEILKGEGTHADDEVLWRSDGTSFPAEYWSYPQRRDGVVVGAVVTFLDITPRKQAEESLQIEQANLKAVFASAPVGMLLLDENTVIVDANSLMVGLVSRGLFHIIQERIGGGLGCVHSLENEKGCGHAAACPACPLRKGITQVLTTGVAIHGAEIQTNLLINGQEQQLWLSVSAEPLLLNGRKHAVVAIDDITARKTLEEDLRVSAWTDKLTGLPNRALLCDRLQQAVLRAKRHTDYHFAVLFLDFDRFKIINDSFGHDVGDLLLQEIAQRLQATVRSGDSLSRQAREHTTARLGGDEFVVLLDGLAQPHDATVVAERLLEALVQPYQLGQYKVYSTASIGIVTGARPFDSADDVLRDADTAMYEAKLAGRGRFVVFDIAMRERVINRLNLESDLRLALDAGQLFLMYQPIVSLQTGELESLEALVRWKHPQRGLIAPGEFIPIAEDTGLILSIGEWVLREACGQFARWRASMGAAAPRSISVNLSRIQLLLPDLPQTIHDILEQTGVPPECLHLEVTESAVMKDAATAIKMLHAIKARGVKLDVDDFGTGYSSLACLHDFPIDVLKIDRSFVMNIDRGRDFAALVHAVAQLARNLNISVVAEGIETVDQALMLQSLDCEFGQGYLFSKPLPAEQVPQFKVNPGVLPGAAASPDPQGVGPAVPENTPSA